MDSEGVKRRLTAILYADVVGFSRMMGEDPEFTHQSLKAGREVFFQEIRSHDGRLVNAPGDSILAEFSSVIDAVQCAVTIQIRQGKVNAALPDLRKMRFRIGVELGEVLVDEAGIYGDGVNIAARLEGLAKPGKVCISRTVHDQVKYRLPFAYHYLGEQRVKNIREPVRAYHVEFEGEFTKGATTGEARSVLPGTPGRKGRKRWIALGMALGTGLIVTMLVVSRMAGWIGPESQLRTIVAGHGNLQLPDKPSIAVLPFLNMSGDPAQDYFADGITEDIITDLSKISGLFVIARNSTFTYKGKAVKVQQVSKDLGVRYVLEGSVRKDSGRVRINAQFIDATTGNHVWAERYDRPLQDVFALQDEIAKEIVESLRIRLTEKEELGLATRQKIDLKAFDYVLRGMELNRVLTKENNEEARRHFQRALEVDPEYGAAYMYLAKTYFQDWVMQWSNDPQVLVDAYRNIQKCMKQEAVRAMCRSFQAVILQWRNQHDQAIADLRSAIESLPNDADILARMAEVLNFAGKSKEALPYIQRAIRLDPVYPFHYLWTLGHSYFLNREHKMALQTFQELKLKNPNFVPANLYMAALYQETGKIQQAKSELKNALKKRPDADLINWIDRLPYKLESDAQRLKDALKTIRDSFTG